MLAKCCNPSCVNPFRYLTDGKLFRLDYDAPVRASVLTKPEYFWLCPICSQTMTLRMCDEGKVIPVALPNSVHVGGGSPIIPNRQKGLLLSRVSFFEPKRIAKPGDLPIDRKSVSVA